MPQRPSTRSPLSDGDPLQNSKSRTGPVGDQAPRVRPERKSAHSRHKGNIGFAIVIGLAAVGLIAAMFIWGIPLLQTKPMNDDQAAMQLIAARLKDREAELKRVESKKEERRLKKEREEAKLVAANEARIEAELRDQPEPASTSDETPADKLPDATKPSTSVKVASTTDIPYATEPTTPVEVASSADLSEDTPTDPSENDPAAERAEDRDADNPAEDAGEVPASNQQGTVAKILPAFTLSRGVSKREISLIKNVRSDQIEDYQLKSFIAGIADDYEVSELPTTGSEISSWAEVAPDSFQDDIALLTLSIQKVARRLVSRKVRITHRSGNDIYPFFEVHLNLHYRSSRKELLLVIEQVLSYPTFSELNGLTVSDPESYYFDKFDKTYSRELTRWDTTVRNGIKKLPGEIGKAQSRINVLRTQIINASGNDVRAINARRSLTSKVDALSKTIAVLERRLINYQAAMPRFSDIKIWYAAAHDDIDLLIERLRIDFDLERQAANGSVVTLVSTRGEN